MVNGPVVVLALLIVAAFIGFGLAYLITLDDEDR